MGSWRKKVNVLLLSVLIVVIMFLLWTNAYYYSQLRLQLKETEENVLDLWIESTTGRLNTIHSHICEVLLTIYNNTAVNPGSSAMDFNTSHKVKTVLEDKLTVNRDIICLFVLDAGDDLFLFTSSPGLDSQKITLLKQFSLEHAADYLTGLHDAQWFITPPIKGEPYLIKGISVGKYTVGAMCSISGFVSTSVPILFGDESVCLASADGAVCFIAGSETLAARLDIGPDGTPSLRGSYTAVSRDFSLAGFTLLVVSKSSPLLENAGWFAPLFLLTISVVCIGLIFLLIRTLRKSVIAPTQELLRAHHEIGRGNLTYRITADAGSEEFDLLYKSFNTMAEHIHALRIESYDRLIKEQENKLQMVRAQIRPHFYLNAITTISNMTYQNRLEDIRRFLQALAKYMRYMLNIQSQWITISEELQHIDNYFQMQQLRFPGSIRTSVCCSEAVGQVKIPFLTLFTLVENCFKHALDLYKPTEISIVCEPVNEKTFHGCRIIVEDNGGGFPEDTLDEFKNGVPDDTLPPKEHLGLSNIRYTLQITYRRNDLLRLSNQNGGAHAEIWIPTEGEVTS